jgi:hypothetical protein
MADTVNVDTLVETVRRGVVSTGFPSPGPIDEALAALSDLAARAREADNYAGYGEILEGMTNRAESLRLELDAERHNRQKDNKYLVGERDRLARRVAELEAALRVAKDLLAQEGYDTDPDYTQEWATVSEPLAGDGGGA